MKTAIRLAALVLVMALGACAGDPAVPKPRGYIRIDLPEHAYQSFDTTWPYAFEYSTSARIIEKRNPDSLPYWIDIDYPAFKGVIYISYRKIENNLPQLLDDGIDLANAHIPKATAMEPSLILRDTASVYGLIYDIRGSGVASTCQFYLTDSLNHFVRGALYFSVVPNNDSLAPVIGFIHDDIEHLINTFRWN